MAIKFGGEFEVKLKPEEVYDFLTDPKKFAPLLPDFQGMSEQDPTHFTVKVKVGISYIKGVAEVKMELTQADRPKRRFRPLTGRERNQGYVAGRSANLWPVDFRCRRSARAARQEECAETNRWFTSSDEMMES